MKENESNLNKKCDFSGEFIPKLKLFSNFNQVSLHVVNSNLLQSLKKAKEVMTTFSLRVVTSVKALST